MTNNNSIDLTSLVYQIGGLKVRESLELLANKFSGKVTFSSSFSFEDQLISHEILANQLPISIFTLDTGRLFSELIAFGTAQTNVTIHISKPIILKPKHYKILLPKKGRILFTKA